MVWQCTIQKKAYCWLTLHNGMTMHGTKKAYCRLTLHNGMTMQGTKKMHIVG